MSHPANAVFHALNRMAAAQLVTPYGRYDRAAVTERARQIYARGNIEWRDARLQAYREASDQLRARFGRPKLSIVK